MIAALLPAHSAEHIRRHFSSAPMVYIHYWEELDQLLRTRSVLARRLIHGCEPRCTGTRVANALGGMAPYTYVWNADGDHHVDPKRTERLAPKSRTRHLRFSRNSRMNFFSFGTTDSYLA